MFWFVLAPLLGLAAPAPAVLTPGPVLVDDVRSPLVALDEVRLRRARRSTLSLMLVAGVEAGTGLLIMGTGQSPGLRAGTGLSLLVGGLFHGLSGYRQSNLSARRHAAFVARLAEIEGKGDEAMFQLARTTKLGLEREARSNAYGAGVYTGVALMGVSALVISTGDADAAEEGLALLVIGSIGAVHHGSRWRAAVRISNDLATLDRGVPTLIPAQGVR